MKGIHPGKFMMIKRTFLITGATKGIGYATAMRLHHQGHLVIGIARNKPEVDFPGAIVTVDLVDGGASIGRSMV